MALPSQGGFSSVRQGGSYRRRRRSHGTSWIILLAIGGLTTWYFWPEDTLSTDSGSLISMSDDTDQYEFAAGSYIGVNYHSHSPEDVIVKNVIAVVEVTYTT